MSIDLETVRDLSILVAACMGAYSIDAWRREFVGKRQMEIAEEVLALFYEARDAVSYMRGPASFGGEQLELERGPSESEANFKARQNASVVFYRYEQKQELFAKLRAIRYRFLAQFGEEKAKPFEDLWSQINRVLVSARLLSRFWARDHFRTPEQQDEHYKRVEEQEAVFWEGYTDPDEVKAGIDQAISDMETICRSIIDGKGTLFGLVNKKL